MKIDALMMDEKDNVVTCVREVKAGETVKYRRGEQECEITAKEDIPLLPQDRSGGSETG